MALNVTPSSIITIQDISSGNVSSCSTISKEYVIFFSCFYIVIALLGLILSGIVLWAIRPEVISLLGLPFYAANLLCAAMLECLVLLFGVSYLLNFLPFDSSTCHVVSLIPKIVQRTAAIFLVWMFTMRYVAVKQPLKYKKLSSVRVCVSVSVILWFTVIVTSVTEQLLTDDNTRNCFPDFRLAKEWAVLDLALAIIFNFLPLCLLGTLGHLIYRALKNSQSVSKEQRERIRMILLLAVFSVGFLSCPLYMVITYLNILVLSGQSLCQVTQEGFLAYQFTFAINTCGVVVAPLFYAFSSSTVNKNVRGLFKKANKDDSNQ